MANHHRENRFFWKRAGIFTGLISLAVWSGGIYSASGQWQTQSFVVKPGWTAMYLHVDPGYTNLDYMVGNDPANPISEVWMWVPTASSIQYVTSPLQPTTPGTQWSSWVRGGAVGATLVSMIPNAAYLIHSLATTNYTWTIKGKPATPNYTWTTTGINLLDFPTTPTNPPLLDAFVSLAPSFQTASFYEYLGGDLGPSNPFQVFAMHTVPVTRGQAFWINSGGAYNNYFGPFKVVINPTGIAFGDSTSTAPFHLQNTTASSVTVRLTLLPSESPPAGQTPIAGVPPLLVRGVMSSSNLTFSASNLTTTSSVSWTLTPQGQPGSDIIITLGLNRTVFTSNPSTLYAGILKFTDSFNYTEIDVPEPAP